MNTQEATARLNRARNAFDVITEASYHGVAFRLAMVEHPELLSTAETLASQLREAMPDIFKPTQASGDVGVESTI